MRAHALVFRHNFLTCLQPRRCISRGRRGMHTFTRLHSRQCTWERKQTIVPLGRSSAYLPLLLSRPLIDFRIFNRCMHMCYPVCRRVCCPRATSTVLAVPPARGTHSLLEAIAASCLDWHCCAPSSSSTSAHRGGQGVGTHPRFYRQANAPTNKMIWPAWR
jgi:hypothetical protein